MKKIKVLISAGGTGGHMIPAQQLSRQLLSEEGVEIFFCAKGLSNNQNFQKDKFSYKDVSSGSFARGDFILSSFLILKGTLESFFYILSKKIDIVVGFGSYHTFPAILAAYLLRKPIVLFESNSYLGKVNRFFAKKARIIAVQFKIADFESYKNIKLVPLLPWIPIEVKMKPSLARKRLGLKEDLFTFLVFGGSQGAVFINEVFSKVAIFLAKERAFQVVHLSGDLEQKEKVKKLYDSLNIPSFVSSYEKDMVPVYSSADLAICRAGAATLSELLFFNLPSILIPFPYSSEDHQQTNGRFFEKEVKGSMIFVQNKFDYQKFVETLLEFTLPSNKNLMEMKNNLCDFKELTEKENRESLTKIIHEVLKKA